MTMRWECLLVRRQLSRYMDAEISDRRAARIERHLAVCQSCQRELDHLVATARFVASERAADPPGWGWHRIEERLAEVGVPGYGRVPRAAGGMPRSLRRPGLRLALAGAALLLLGVFVLPRVVRLTAPQPALAHKIDVQEFMGDLSQHPLDNRASFWKTYRVQTTTPAKAAKACPEGRPPASEIPAGFALNRSMVLQTDCCYGLLLEYRRGDSSIYVVQIPEHHPMDWGTEQYEERSIGMDTFQVHDEGGIRGVVRNGRAVNLLVAGDPDTDVLGEVATYLNARAEAAVRPQGR